MLIRTTDNGKYDAIIVDFIRQRSNGTTYYCVLVHPCRELSYGVSCDSADGIEWPLLTCKRASKRTDEQAYKAAVSILPNCIRHICGKQGIRLKQDWKVPNKSALALTVR